MVSVRDLKEVLQQATASAVESGHVQLEIFKATIVQTTVNYFRSKWDLSTPVFTNGVFRLPEDMSTVHDRLSDIDWSLEGEATKKLSERWREIVVDILGPGFKTAESIELLIEETAKKMFEELAFLGKPAEIFVAHFSAFLQTVLGDGLSVIDFGISHYFVIFMVIDLAERLFFLKTRESKNYYAGEVMQNPKVVKTMFERWTSAIPKNGITTKEIADLEICETGFTSEKLIAVSRMQEDIVGLESESRERAVQFYSARQASTSKLKKIWFNGVSNEHLLMMAQEWPEFNFVEVTKKFAHPGLALCRRADITLIASEQKNGVHLVGPSIEQISFFEKVQHACVPSVTGRDDARHNMKALDEAYKDHICHKTFENCTETVRVKDAVSVWLFSAQSVDVDDVIKSMVAKKQRKAILLLVLSAPFMIDGVNEWRCDKTGTRFRRDGKNKRIAVMHAGDGEAGYVDDEDAHLSWLRPLPYYPGLHVNREVRRSFGCHYHFELTIGFGPAEEYPTSYKIFKEPTYVIPMFEEGVYTTAPARQVDMVVDAIMYPGSTKTLEELVASKVRSTRVELRIGGMSVRGRWEITGEEFPAIIAFIIVLVQRRRKIVEYLKKTNAPVSDSAMRDEMQDLWSLVVRDKLRTITRDKYVLRQKRSFLSRMMMGDGVVRFVEGPLWWKPYSSVDIINHVKSRWFDDQRLASLVSRTVTFAASLGVKAVRAYLEALPNRLPMEEYLYKLVSANTASDATLRLIEGETARQPLRLDINRGVVRSGQQAQASAEVVLEEEGKREEGDVNFRHMFGDLSKIVVSQDELAIYLDQTSFEPCNDALVDLSLVDECELSSIGGGHEMAMLLALDDKDVLDVQGARDLVGIMMSLGTVLGNEYNGPAIEVRFDQTPMQGEVYRIVEPQMIERMFFDGEVCFTVPQVNRAMFIFCWATIKEIQTGVDKRRQAAISLVGVASSGKTSVMNECARRDGRRWLAVVPSKDMKNALTEKKPKNMTVVTRHGGAAALRTRPDVIWIDEIYQFSVLEIEAWQVITASIGAHLVVSGEGRQGWRESATVLADIDRSISAKFTRNLSVANAVNLTTCYVLDKLISYPLRTRLNQAGNFYQKHDRSITGIEDIFICARKDDAWPVQTSASTCQGLRYTDAAIAYTEDEINYYAGQPGPLYVALTRPKRDTLLIGPMLSAFTWEPVAPLLVNGWSNTVGDGIRETRLTMDTETSFEELEQLPALNNEETNVPNVETIVAVDTFKPHHHFSGHAVAEPCTNELEEGLLRQQMEVPFIFATDGTIVSNHRQKSVALQYSGAIPAEQSNISSLEGAQNIVAVQQSSNFADEVGNTLMRTLKPRTAEELTVNHSEATRICEAIKELFDKSLVMEFSPTWKHWEKTRTREKLESLRQTVCGTFGEEGGSTRFQMFLKKQNKVKEDPTKCLKEGYGQPIMSPSAMYNAEMASLMMQVVNVMILCPKDNVFFDLGVSATDYAHLMRCNSHFDIEGCTGYDIQAQDTSHNATTNEAFCLFMKWIGCEVGLVDVYREMRRSWDFRSMSGEGMKGVVQENLASGDPFTIAVNCFETAMVFVDRFERLTPASYLKIKGDNMETPSKEIKGRYKSMRSIKQTIEYQNVSHFAGYVTAGENTIQDPIKTVIKFFAMGEFPNGGLVALHSGLADRFVKDSVDEYDQFLLTLSGTYHKIFTEGGVREGFSEFLRLTKFGYMLSKINRNALRPYYCNTQRDCFARSVIFLRFNIPPHTLNKLREYHEIKAYIIAHPDLAARTTFYESHFAETEIKPKNGLHVFLDHAVGISPVPVNIEEAGKRFKSYRETLSTERIHGGMVLRHATDGQAKQNERHDEFPKTSRFGQGWQNEAARNLSRSWSGPSQRTSYVWRNLAHTPQEEVSQPGKPSHSDRHSDRGRGS